jgi:hypothetical protein
MEQATTCQHHKIRCQGDDGPDRGPYGQTTLRKLADATGCRTEKDAIQWLARMKKGLFENISGQLSLTVKASLLLDNMRRF